MTPLREVLDDAEENNTAVGHFNISDSTMLKAIFEAARELRLPVVIGVSEGEREFIGAGEAVAMVRDLRREFSHPIFLNADHTRSLEKVQEAVAAGFDAILFDGGTLSLEENIRQTREVVAYVKSVNPEILVEGELGYIGASSEVFEKIPEGAAVRPEDLTRPEDAKRFAEETGIDLLAPAVGNIHGMLVRQSSEVDGGFAPMNPRLDISRIAAIKKAAGIPLVLHGGSGIRDEDFTRAIRAGIAVIHISTEVRVAWRKGLEQGLKAHPKEFAPYKIMPSEIEAIKKIVQARLKLFGNRK